MRSIVIEERIPDLGELELKGVEGMRTRTTLEIHDRGVVGTGPAGEHSDDEFHIPFAAVPILGTVS